jgi:hypothetical protein
LLEQFYPRQLPEGSCLDAFANEQLLEGSCLAGNFAKRIAGQRLTSRLEHLTIPLIQL